MTDSITEMIELAIERADEGIGRADRHAAGTCACGPTCDKRYWVETRAFWFGQSAYWRGKHAEMTSIAAGGHITNQHAPYRLPDCEHFSETGCDCANPDVKCEKLS